MKEKLFKKGITRRLFSVILALAMVLTLIPMNSMTAYATDTCNKCTVCGHSSCLLMGCRDCYLDGPCDTRGAGSWCVLAPGHDGDCSSTGPHDHGNFASGWSSNAAGHWHACGNSDCDVTETNVSSHTADGFAYAEHSFGYSAHDNVLTASCVCGKSVSLTLTASSANYSGSAVTADYGEGEKLLWANAVGGTAPEITYEEKNADNTWTEITSAPTAVGEYRAVAKVTKDSTDYTAYKEFSIDKIDITEVTFTEPTAPAYGGTPASSVAGTGDNYSGAISWSPAATTFGYSTAYTATITLTAADNYKFKSDVSIPENWTKATTTSTDTSLVLTRTYTATEAAPHTCSSGVKQDGQAATCTEDGWKDYYKCSETTCSKLFAEEDCTTEITDLDAWKIGAGKIAALKHEWGYAANGATITATCTRNSAHTIAITLVEDAATFIGIEGLGDFNTATGLEVAASDIKLYTATTEGATTGGTLYEGGLYKGCPIQKGNYYAALTVGTATAVKAFKTAKTWTAADGKFIDYTQFKVGDKISEFDSGTNWFWIVSDEPYYLFYRTEPNAECFFSTNDEEVTGFNRFAPGDSWRDTYDGYVLTSAYVYTVVEDPRHSHDWQYSATGNKLEAYCANAECSSGTSSTNRVSLVLSASDAEYSGSAVEATLSDTTAWVEAGFTVPVIEYVDQAGNVSETAPSAVGSYTARIKVGDKTATKSFRIKSAYVPPVIPPVYDYPPVVVTPTPTPEATPTPKPEVTPTPSVNNYVEDEEYHTPSRTSEVSVPETYKSGDTEYVVVSLKKNAFNGKYVEKVTLPKTIERICYRAFVGDKQLEEVFITSKKIEIEPGAFNGVGRKAKKRIKIYVSTNMSKKNFKALKKQLVAEGILAENIIRK